MNRSRKPTLKEVQQSTQSGIDTFGKVAAGTETALGVAALGATAGGIGYGLYKLFGGKKSPGKLSGKAIGK